MTLLFEICCPCDIAKLLKVVTKNLDSVDSSIISIVVLFDSNCLDCLFGIYLDCVPIIYIIFSDLSLMHVALHIVLE